MNDPAHPDGQERRITGESCGYCGATLRDGDYSRRVGVEYAYGPERYDGISEWMCPDCGAREGRWTGRLLGEGEIEPRYGGRPMPPDLQVGDEIVELGGDSWAVTEVRSPERTGDFVRVGHGQMGMLSYQPGEIALIRPRRPKGER